MKEILIIEDSPVCRELFAEVLRLSGYAVRSAADGPDALTLLQGTPPDLIILDLNLPSIGGLTLLKHLRALPAVRYVPVIVLTGVAEADAIRQAGLLGVRHYVLKDRLSVDELMPRVRACIGDGDPAAAPAA